jgi:hypothetical protein
MAVAEALLQGLEHEEIETDETEPASLDWFLAMLQAAMTEVMASEGKPLQKANAVARLGNLYLKACRTQELQAANRALARRVAALEERLATTESRVSAAERPSREARPPALTAGLMPETMRARRPRSQEGVPPPGAGRGAQASDRKLVTALAPGRASP